MKLVRIFCLWVAMQIPALSFGFLLAGSTKIMVTGLAGSSSDQAVSNKQNLLDKLAETPRNRRTPASLTKDILQAVRSLEQVCPTEDDQVVDALAGIWELLWTTQDPDAPESRRPFFLNFINPLENQQYSINPNGGRADPFLPQPVQDRLQELGLVAPLDEPVRSSQAIDLNKRTVRNVVAFNTGSRKATLTVMVDFTPDSTDPRRINVKFLSCRVVWSPAVDVTIPLGLMGPTGWLKTTYIDEGLRITRGHKGSVFVLQR